MDALQSGSDLKVLLADLETLARQAARPPDEPLCEAANVALSRLYNRFIRRVFAFCSKRVRFSLPATCSLQEFVQDLFVRFLRSADNVTISNKDSLPDVEAQLLKCFHGHAVWALRDKLRESKGADNLAGAFLRDMGSQRSDSDQPGDPRVAVNRNRLRVAMSAMGDRARDVLLTSFQHIDLETGEFHLPLEVREQLCSRCQFNSANAMVKFRTRKMAELRSQLSSVA
jgi:DNA-directed RNA polymerase specialized sigma24 family protein